MLVHHHALPSPVEDCETQCSAEYWTMTAREETRASLVQTDGLLPDEVVKKGLQGHPAAPALDFRRRLIAECPDRADLALQLIFDALRGG